MNLKYLKVMLFLVISMLIGTSAKMSDLKIGVIFSRNEWNSTSVRAVDEAVEMINKRSDILPHRRLVYTPIFSDDNTFRLTRDVCNGVESGFRAIIGPSATLTSLHVQSICNGLDIPHIDNRVKKVLAKLTVASFVSAKQSV